MKILFIGDIVARLGRKAVAEALPKIIKEESPNIVIANAENLAHGRGATRETLEEMQNCGINFFTSGDHLFWHKGFADEVDELPIIRPANFPEATPGVGYKVLDLGVMGRILIMNLMGQVLFSSETLNSPFEAVDQILEETEGQYDVSFLDFHAEATSEKHAMGFYLDGKVDAVVGTHTHVPTCDARVLPKGTLYVTDAGMSGSTDSVLGVKSEIIVDRSAYGKKQRFEWEEKGRTAFRSVLLDLENKEIRRIDIETSTY